MAHLAGWHWADWAPRAFLTLCGWRQVNGQNVEGLRHAEVVARIKAQEDEARLLVVDPETDEYFKRLRVVPTEEHVEGRLLPSGRRVGSVQLLTCCPHRSTAITSHERNQSCPGERVCPSDHTDTSTSVPDMIGRGCFWKSLPLTMYGCETNWLPQNVHCASQALVPALGSRKQADL